jgi:hypothetical protein
MQCHQVQTLSVLLVSSFAFPMSRLFLYCDLWLWASHFPSSVTPTEQVTSGAVCDKQGQS